MHTYTSPCIHCKLICCTQLDVIRTVDILLTLHDVHALDAVDLQGLLKHRGARGLHAEATIKEKDNEEEAPDHDRHHTHNKSSKKKATARGARYSSKRPALSRD